MGGRSTPAASVLAAAAELLAGVWGAGKGHGVSPADWGGIFGGDERLAQAALNAQVTVDRRASLGDLDDPLKLLVDAAAAAKLETIDAQTVGGDGWSSRAYIVLARLPETPAWGPSRDAPLVVSLERSDCTSCPSWE